MISGLNSLYRSSGTALFAFEHVETSAGVFIEFGLVRLAVSALHVLIQILLIHLLNVFALKLALQYQVVFRPDHTLRAAFSRHVTQNMVMFPVNGYHHGVEVLPGRLGSTEFHDVWVFGLLQLAAFRQLRVLISEQFTDPFVQIRVQVLYMTFHRQQTYLL